MKRMLCIVSFACALFYGIVYSQHSPAAPTDTASAMFTIEDVYNRLNSGIAGAKRSGAFAEPSSGPSKTMHTLNDVMNKAPLMNNTTGATPADVLSGTEYWGLKSGEWGLQTGTLPHIGTQTITPGTSSQTISQGYHNGTGTVAGDANLTSDNIKRSTTIFGVSGDSNIVNTGTGDADSTMISSGKKVWVKGREITGRLAGGVILNEGGSYSSEGRWYDNADGTIIDMTTGLVWLKTVTTTTRPFMAESTAYIDVPQYLYSLKNGVAGLADGSKNGDWRIPTLKEMQSLRSGAEAISAGNMQGFSGSQSSSYWTATHYSPDVSRISIIKMDNGAISGGDKCIPPYSFYLIWPVRNALLP